ncbi:ImmA/IrrE family metallo-endopeptidase [Thomasclavelia ramosa]|uniref:ImmA/IrrE family metallo-endopeptidase n=1 Tax=Thomasclavelia ramosa TaxID=1547 RepID=UPI00344FABAD
MLSLYKKSREVINMCVFDEMRKENNYFKDFYDVEKIEIIATEIREMFGLKETPTQIANILNKVGFKIYSLEMDETLSGRIGIANEFKEILGSKKILQINSKDNRGHQRFTMAHELGHYIFDYDGHNRYANAYSLAEDDVNSPGEIRVNRFAASLLMPKNIFVDKYTARKTLGLDEVSICKSLAEEFEVSETAVSKRIVELGLH